MSVNSAEAISATPNAPKNDTHYLPTPYQEQMHKSKYARWVEELGRRETWTETVDRFVEYVKEHLELRGTPLTSALYLEIREAILHQDILPSMRALMTAGPALRRDEVAAYNCAFMNVDRVEAFNESMYVLMCGTGVGFSVERKHVEKLPVVPETFINDATKVIVVEDSKYGWAEALRELISALYDGRILDWDVSKVRPAGAILKTFGGRASGPQPLIDLLEYVVHTFLDAAGRKLTSREAHGIMCKIGDVVVVGGVRRSAELSLSDLDDADMRDSKSGEWFVDHPEYGLANNSAVYEYKPTRERFDEEWIALQLSGSGERGIFNREAAKAKVKSLGTRDWNYDFGLNPCGEIILRDRQFCNLSQVTVRADDTEQTLARKCYLAAVVGTVQSTFTNFTYLSDEWKKNCEDERLVGVGMTGVMDNVLLNGTAGNDLASLLDRLRVGVRSACEEVAGILGINVPAAATCMKPAGNSTQLVGAHSSGMHKAHARRYIRRFRGNKNDPVAQLLYYQGFPAEDEVFHPDSTWVFSCPMETPEGALTRDSQTAIETLEHWLIFAEHWCEHNPSMTVTVKDHEWEEVGNWVYEHLDRMIGVSFLPHDGHTYQQAPYEEITKEQYDALVTEIPESLDWSMLEVFESSDQTVGSQELACLSGACEI